MSLQNTRPAARPRRASLWSRLASKALARLLGNAPPIMAQSPSTPRHPMVGVRKSALCKDARGEIRRIDLFLPADLVGELSRPLDIRFLDGEEPVTACEIGSAIRSNFAVADSRRAPVRVAFPDKPTTRAS